MGVKPGGWFARAHAQQARLCRVGNLVVPETVKDWLMRLVPERPREDAFLTSTA